MISWEALIPGREPAGGEEKGDVCWFPDFDSQEYLLPHFDVGETPIDQYGRTKFSTADVRRLRVHLEDFRGSLEAKPESWSITETGHGVSRTMTLNRDDLLAVIDKTLLMAERAIQEGGGLVFLGD